MSTRASRRLQPDQQQHSYKVGDRVLTAKDGQAGTVQFVGQTEFASGKWVGIALDDGGGKNDGAIGGKRYFDCAPAHGIFVREAQIVLEVSSRGGSISSASSAARGSSSSSTRAEKQGEGDANANADTTADAGTVGAPRVTRSKLADLKEKRNAVLQKARDINKSPSSSSSSSASPTDSLIAPATNEGSNSSSSRSKRSGTTTTSMRGGVTPRASLGVGASSLPPPSSSSSSSPSSIRSSLGVGPTTFAAAASRRQNQAAKGGPLRAQHPSSSSSSSSSSSMGRRASLAVGGGGGGGGGRGGERDDLDTSLARAKRPPPPPFSEPMEEDEEEEQELCGEAAAATAPAVPSSPSSPSSSSSFSFSAAPMEESTFPPPTITTSTTTTNSISSSSRDNNNPFDDPNYLNLSLGGTLGTISANSGNSHSSSSSSSIPSHGRMSMSGRLSFIGGKEGGREGRRLSMGGREGDLTTQVNGLKTLLHKKNLELETMKGKVEEGREEGKEAQRLAQALTAVVEKMEEEKERAGREREEMMREMARAKEGWEEAAGRASKKEKEVAVLVGKMAETEEQLHQAQAQIKMASLSISASSSEKEQQQQQEQQEQQLQQQQQLQQLYKEREAENARLLALSHAQCQELEARTKKQESTILSLECDIRSLHSKLAHTHHEEEDRHKQKNTDLAKQQAAAATAARKAGELEAQVVSLNDMVELLAMDKEQLLIDQEVAEERMEGMSIEIETLKLELEHALEEAAAAATGAGSQGGGEEGGREEVVGQNQRLRAALKRLQEVNVQERQESSRRERQLEKELAIREACERQAQELLAWKKRKEVELEALHEQVEAGQAFAMMVERLTEQNLGLEEKVSDLRLAVSELEVAQEMSEELEEGQAEEARQLRGECGRLMVLLAEKEEGLRQAEGRTGERERLLGRLKGVLGNLTRERDALREEVEERRMALGVAKEQVEGVMEEVQGMRGQALLVREKTMQAAKATIEAWSAQAKVERVLAVVPREVWKECQGRGEGGGVEEGKALEGDLCLARVGAKVEVALEVLKEGGFAGISLPSSSSSSPSSSAATAFLSSTALLRQGGETCQDRGNRAAHEGRLALTLSHVRRLAHFTLLHTQQQQQQQHSEEAFSSSSAAAAAASAAAARSAAAGTALAPIERLLDELLLVLQEEGGVPETHFPLPPLLQVLAHAESVLLPEVRREGGGEDGLWEETGAGGLVQLAPFLAVCLLIQAVMVEEEGKGGREKGGGKERRRQGGR